MCIVIHTHVNIFNNNVIREAKKNNAYAIDRYGNTLYMGYWEQEEHMKRFKTLGAKKYAYEDDEGKLHLTLAGVNKKLGAEELADYGGLEAFKEGFVFKKGGGTEAIYNDNIDIVYKIGKHTLHIKDNVYIKDGSYTLGLTAEYMALLEDSELWLEVVNKEML